MFENIISFFKKLGKKETIKHGLSKVKKHFQWVETLLLDTILLYFKGKKGW